jgi:exosortase A-associated hydrolase 2
MRGAAAVFVPPFTEEMNKSRRVMTLAARALAESGVASLIVDLYGTGDSAGDFSDARWEIWRSDIACACGWLASREYGPIHLIGLRMGALLALDATAAIPVVERAVLWQPVLAGDAWVAQFLRTDVVARMMAQADTRATTDTLRARLRDGEAIEVAGYTLAPALVQALESRKLESLVPDRPLRVDWLDVLLDRDRAPSPAGERVRHAWVERGLSVSYQSVCGPPFWSSVEIAEAPELVEATVARIIKP